MDLGIDFKPYFKVHNLVSVHPKSIIRGQMINLNMIFHVVVSVYWLVKTWNSSQFPAEFRNIMSSFFYLVIFLFVLVICFYFLFICLFSQSISSAC